MSQMKDAEVDIEGMPLFSNVEVVRFQQAADILLLTTQLEPSRICTIKPTNCPGRSAVYVVDLDCLNNWRDIYQDDYCPWGGASGASAFYNITTDGLAVRVDQQKRLNNGQHYDWRISRVWYRHPATQLLFQKSLFNAYQGKSKRPKYALISYRWLCVPYSFDPLTPVELKNSRTSKRAVAIIEDEPMTGDEEYEQEEVEEVETVPGQIVLYSDVAMMSFSDVIKVVAFDNNPQKMCNMVPLIFEGQESTFLVDFSLLENWKDVFRDDYTPWGQSSGSRAYYRVDYDEQKVTRMDEGGKIAGNKDYDWLIVRCYVKHAATGGKLTKSVYTCYRKGDRTPSYGIITYKWLCEPFEFEKVPQGAVIGRETSGRYTNRLSAVIDSVVDYDEIDVEAIEDDKELVRGNKKRKKKHDNMFAMQAANERKMADMQARMDNLEYENRACHSQINQMQETIKDQKTEISYLRSILNNDSQLAPLLRGVSNIPGIKLSFPGIGAKCVQKSTGEALASPNKRLKYEGAPEGTAGVCLHVQNGDVSVEFCAKCSSNNNPNSAIPYVIRSHQHMRSFPQPEDNYCSNMSFSEAQELQVAEVHIFAEESVNVISDAAEIMAFRSDDSGVVSNARPLVCIGQAATFLVDLDHLPHWKDIFVDNYGSWGGASGSKGYFVIDQPNRRAYRVDNRCKIDPSTPYNLLIRRCSYKHPACDGQFRKSIYLGYRYGAHVPKWAVVSFEWDCEPYDFAPQPHGNSRKSVLPFQPTPASVRRRIKDLSTVMRPDQVYRSVIQESDGTADMPRNVRQATNIAYHTPGRIPSTSNRGRPRTKRSIEEETPPKLRRYEEEEDDVEVEDYGSQVVYVEEVI